jgi:hypothetical protein
MSLFHTSYLTTAASKVCQWHMLTFALSKCYRTILSMNSLIVIYNSGTGGMIWCTEPQGGDCWGVCGIFLTRSLPRTQVTAMARLWCMHPRLPFSAPPSLFIDCQCLLSPSIPVRWHTAGDPTLAMHGRHARDRWPLTAPDLEPMATSC